jgi:hypothetical protein
MEDPDQLFDTALDLQHSILEGNQFENDLEDDDILSFRTWFDMPITASNLNLWQNKITSAVLDKYARQSHSNWFTLLTDDIQYTNDTSGNLKKWISSIAPSHLANLLSQIPVGVNDHRIGHEHEILFKFTPMQRLFIHVACTRPFSVTASASCSQEQILRIQYPNGPPPQARRRKGIYRQVTMRGGDIPEYVVLSLATYSGKTAIALSMALLLLTSKFERLVQTVHSRLAGRMFDGPQNPTIPRIAIVSAPSGTLQHFIDTAKGLVNAWKMSHPGLTFKFWEMAGETRTNLRIAHEDPDTVYFWFLPSDKLYEVLKRQPEFYVPVCIFDEFPPSYRADTAISPIACNILNQATVDLWTRNSRSVLSRHIFGGRLIPPSNIAHTISCSGFSEASLGMQQLCTMSVIESGAFFTSAIREELKKLVPAALLVMSVKCRRRTISSAIGGLHTDLLPVTVKDSVVNHFIRKDSHIYDPSSIIELKVKLDQPNLTPNIIVESLMLVKIHPGCRPENVANWQSRIDVVIQRLSSRIQEFAMDDCPICYSAEEGLEPAVMNCCGFTLCNPCRTQCIERNNRCPQCREPICAGFNPQDVSINPSPQVQPPQPPPDTNYPPFPQDLHVGRPFPTMQHEAELFQLISERTSFANTQILNTVLTLQILRASGYVRPLIICESIPGWQHRSGLQLNFQRLGECSGFDIENVTHSFSGRGRNFTAVKREFDNPSNRPMAIACVGNFEQFLVGTNFDYADCLVSVGKIHSDILMQAVGRVRRPRFSRNNQLSTPFINISV